jgi:RNA polymerase sigma-70 factor (ECF subfamily)
LAAQQAYRDLTNILRRDLSRALGSRPGVDETVLKDFVQDALIKIRHNLDSFRGDCRFTTWAKAVALRTALTALRRAHWKNVSLDDVVLGRLEYRAPAPTPEQHSQRAEVVDVLFKLIEGELSPHQSKAVLGTLGGVPHALLAEQLGLNRNALYKVVHDARKKLRVGLERHGIRAEDVRELFHE